MYMYYMVTFIHQLVYDTLKIQKKHHINCIKVKIIFSETNYYSRDESFQTSLSFILDDRYVM